MMQLLDNALWPNDCRNNISLKIADIKIGITSNTPGLKLQVDGAMNKFFTPESEPELIVQVVLDHLSNESRGEKLFDSGSLWQLHLEDKTYCFRFTSPAYGSLPYKVALFDETFTFGNIRLNRSYFSEGRIVSPLEYPLDELLLLHLLAKGRGVEVHACGLVDSHGRGHLFLGQSGAGKTTMARLWLEEPEATILSDDRIILRYNEGRFWIYGTPWHGEAELFCPAKAPLEKIYFLGKGSTNELIPLTKIEATARLFVCSFSPHYSREGLHFTLGFLSQMVESLPCYELRFVPDKKILKLIGREKTRRYS